MKAIKLTTATLLLSASFTAYPSMAVEEISAAPGTSYSRVQEVQKTNNQVLDPDWNNALSVSLDQLEVQYQPGLSRNNLYQVSEDINSQMDRNRQRWELEVDWENNKLQRFF